jgi:hypothetical protein
MSRTRVVEEVLSMTRHGSRRRRRRRGGRSDR